MKNILVNLSHVYDSKENPFNGGAEYTTTVVHSIINKLLKGYFPSVKLFLYINSKLLPDSLNEFIIDNLSIYYIDPCDESNLNIILKEYKIDRFVDFLANPKVLDLIDFENVELIFTIHGLRALEMPTDSAEYFQGKKVSFLLKTLFKQIYFYRVQKMYKTLILKKSKKTKVVVPSLHTKFSIVLMLGCDPRNIEVLYSPIKLNSINKYKSSKLESNISEILTRSFFLIVSSKRWLKNTYRAIQAFDYLIENNLMEGKTVVLTGADDKVVSLTKYPDNYFFLDYINSNDLELLYENSYALVYPTLNEGFGYPPLECMKYGTPVISAMISSTIEIIGQYVIGFNPFDHYELANRIYMIIYDNNIYSYYSNLSKKGFEIVKNRQIDDLDKLVNLVLNE